jgi:hypothetical protein
LPAGAIPGATNDQRKPRLISGAVPWRLGSGVHDPGMIVLDLATTLALGGDCAADITKLRG